MTEHEALTFRATPVQSGSGSDLKHLRQRRWNEIYAAGSDAFFLDFSEVGSRDMQLDHRRFVSVRFSFARFVGCSFAGVTLWFSFLDHAHFFHCDFNGVTLTNSCLAGSTFDSCTFENADITGTSFCGARIERCSFSGSNLERSRFISARLIRPSFEDCNLKGCDFTRAQILRPDVRLANVDDAVGWRDAYVDTDLEEHG